MSSLLPNPRPTLMLEAGRTSEEEVADVGYGETGRVADEKLILGMVEDEMQPLQEGDEGRLVEEVERYGEVLPEDNEGFLKDGGYDGQKPREGVDESGYEEDVGEDLDNRTTDYGQKSMEKAEEDLRYVKDEKLKVEVYEEYVRECLEGKDEVLMDRIDVKIEGKAELDEEPILERSRREQQLVEVHQQVIVAVESDEKNGINVSAVEKLDLVPRGVVERGTDKNVNVSNENESSAEETNTVEICEIVEEWNDKNLINIDETNKRSEDKNKNLIEEIEVAKGERKIEGPEENEETQTGKEEHFVEMGDVIQGNRGEKYVDTVSGIDKPIVDVGELINGVKVEDIAGILDERRELGNKNLMTQREGTKNLSSGMVDAGLLVEKGEEKERVVHPNADAREIADESGFNLSDDKNESREVHDNSEDDEIASNHIPEGSADTFELGVSVKATEREKAGIGSEMDRDMPANEVAVINEEKIWASMKALQTVVGYKAKPLASCVEELKALYIFAGVEPPTSFKSPTDLVEVHEKLLFLMSIVGVK
ncbi:hypothetical protein NMG60_11031162 [Bertholletia excelsa]